MVENAGCAAAVIRAKVPEKARNMMRTVINSVGDWRSGLCIANS